MFGGGGGESSFCSFSSGGRGRGSASIDFYFLSFKRRREEGSGNICEGKHKEGATDAASTGVDVVFRRRRG